MSRVTRQRITQALTTVMLMAGPKAANDITDLFDEIAADLEAARTEIERLQGEIATLEEIARGEDN